jgi:hypothetical protein
MNYIKQIFYKNKILKTSNISDDEALKQLALKTDNIKNFNFDKVSIEKAIVAITNLINKDKAT